MWGDSSFAVRRDMLATMKTLARILACLFGLLALLLIVGVAATWAPDRPVSELRARWAPPPSVFVDLGGMQVHLRDEGPHDDPTPIVLLHGTSASLHTWEGWVQALKAQHRVIRFDLPGFGLTGPSPDGVYSIESYVRFMQGMLDKLGIARCVLAGNSFGGSVSMATALAFPGRVEKLILVDSGGYPPQSISVPIAFRLAQLPVLNRLALIALPRQIIESSVRKSYGDPSRVTPELVDRYFEITLREGNRRAVAERFRQAPSGIFADQIPKLKLPTLILWGGRDLLVPPVIAERFHHDIAGSQVVMFDDLGHVPQEEDPVRTVAAVVQFLAVR